ncbi:MAG: YqeG family HAD IIIA-type phosphatase [Lachnospiraceae bacterium]|nr:YqeG family HAD IIIA-type phosphatase [Lachnospiraceae bacterium]MDN4741927.1 YqeG family HAD IIIA-type phosphatase [Lachnospiraceae bacterium C1.1]
MFERFYPDEECNSVYKIDFEKFYAKGYRGVIFDIDNTLVPHNAPADRNAIRLFKRLKRIGFKVMLLSNNGKKRVEKFNDAVKAEYIHFACKPSKKGYIKAMEMMGTKPENTFFVGDQLFTDVWGAKRVGIHSILVRPMNPKEEIQIILKRLPEKILLKRYHRKKNS